MRTAKDPTVSMKESTSSAGTSDTVQPPHPAPVSREPRAPFSLVVEVEVVVVVVGKDMSALRKESVR